MLVPGSDSPSGLTYGTGGGSAVPRFSGPGTLRMSRLSVHAISTVGVSGTWPLFGVQLGRPACGSGGRWDTVPMSMKSPSKGTVPFLAQRLLYAFHWICPTTGTPLTWPTPLRYRETLVTSLRKSGEGPGLAIAARTSPVCRMGGAFRAASASFTKRPNVPDLSSLKSTQARTSLPAVKAIEGQI